jgi:hypothetical protein
MITKFATVYAGHVDLPDMGQDATPANERRFSNEQLATVGTPQAVMLEQLRWFAKEVMPRFRARA